MDFLTQIYTLKQKIESLSKIHQKKILKILIKNKIKYSENRNGCFINMNLFNQSIIDNINKELIYISQQEKNLNEIEEIKNTLNNNFFIKQNIQHNNNNNLNKDNKDLT